MHQMHLRKILEWEEHLASLESQIYRLSEDQQQIQIQIQQIWMHQSATTNSTAPPPFLFANAVKAAESGAGDMARQ